MRGRRNAYRLRTVSHERCPIVVSDFTATTAVGGGRDALLQALLARRGALRACEFGPPELARFGRLHRVETYVGEVAGVDKVELPPNLVQFDCRNNRLALLGLDKDGFADAVGPGAASARGASPFYLARARQGSYKPNGLTGGAVVWRVCPKIFPMPPLYNSFSLAAFMPQYLGCAARPTSLDGMLLERQGVCAAARLARAGLVDAAVVGGVDSLCLTTLYGFESLELCRPPCRPFAADRDGISIGEGAGFALLERSRGAGAARLCSAWARSSDAHHMSYAASRGARRGARDARRALGAGLSAAISTTSTCTAPPRPANDAAEGGAVAAVFGSQAGQLDQGMRPAHAGRCGHVEAVICAWRSR